MRKASLLDPLLSKPVQGILSAVLLDRDEPWYLSDLAKRLGRTPSTLQRPLDSLVSAGILRRFADGNRVYYAEDAACPILPELKGLLTKTVGLADILRQALAKYGKRIEVAFIYGSMARGEETSKSDVDLLIIGDTTLKDLTPSLSRAEKELGRPVNATIFSGSEFSQKLRQKNHFLRSILATEKIFVLGTEHELEELAKPGTRRAAHDQQGGA